MTELIRRGVYALPAAGFLTVVPWIFIFGPQLRTDPHRVFSTQYVIGGYLYLAGLICLLVGLLALYGHLAQTRGSSWAGLGVTLSVVGIALALPFFGITTLADTVLGDVYLGGQKEVGPALGLLSDKTLTYRTTGHLLLFVIVCLAGAIAYAVAIWKSDSLPKWAGVILAVGFALSMSLSPVFAWVGSLALVIGGIWLARSGLPSPPHGRSIHSAWSD